MNERGLAPEACDLIVHNATLLTVDADDRVIAPGALAIRAGQIIAVDADKAVRDRYTGRQQLDAGGAIVHPGFIDAHIHVSQYTARSVIGLMEGTAVTQGHWKGALRPEDEHASAMLAAVDYLKCGYTGFVDPGTIFEPDAVASVADEVGIRIWLTDPYVADRGETLRADLGYLVSDSFLARWPRNLDEAAKRLGTQLFRNKQSDGLVKAFIGIFGEDTDSPELYRTAFDMAHANGVRFQEHLGYVPATHRVHEKRLGRPILQHLEDEGLLAPHVTFIHMNLVRADEVALLARHGVRIVWCPYSQMQMIGRGGAEPRMTALHRARVPVGIASDIPRTHNFDALGTLAMAASSAAGDPMTFREILRALTIGAATTVGAEVEVGNLEAGKRADFVVRQPAASESFGFDLPLEGAIIGGQHSIRAVFVNGISVLRDGNFERCDEHTVHAAAHASARSLASRIGLIA
jgi:5-methylthioadenosine/S-adenosylhomocysteine deaminase